jgi:hypothetical protein
MGILSVLKIQDEEEKEQKLRREQELMRENEELRQRLLQMQHDMAIMGLTNLASSDT